MINARNKGHRTVAYGKQDFFARGYIGSNLEKSGRFTKEKDLFGLWDYLFIKGKEHVFVQFKTNMRGQKWLNPFIDFAIAHGSENVKYEVWNWRDRKGFEVVRLC